MNGEVVSVVSILGEIVGRLKGESETTVTLSDPRLFCLLYTSDAADE